MSSSRAPRSGSAPPATLAPSISSSSPASPATLVVAKSLFKNYRSRVPCPACKVLDTLNLDGTANDTYRVKCKKCGKTAALLTHIYPQLVALQTAILPIPPSPTSSIALSSAVTVAARDTSITPPPPSLPSKSPASSSLAALTPDRSVFMADAPDLDDEFADASATIDPDFDVEAVLARHPPSSSSLADGGLAATVIDQRIIIDSLRKQLASANANINALTSEVGRLSSEISRLSGHLLGDSIHAPRSHSPATRGRPATPRARSVTFADPSSASSSAPTPPPPSPSHRRRTSPSPSTNPRPSWATVARTAPLSVKARVDALLPEGSAEDKATLAAAMSSQIHRRSARVTRQSLGTPFRRLYISGLPRQSLKDVKDLFYKSHCLVSKIINLSFVGPSILEALVHEEAATHFLRKMKALGLTPLSSFDPSVALDPAATLEIRKQVYTSFRRRIDILSTNSTRQDVREYFTAWLASPHFPSSPADTASPTPPPPQ